MGEIVSIGDSLFITVFSMAVVFIVLMTISYLINILRIVSNEKEQKKTPEKSNIVTEKENKELKRSENVATKENIDDEKLVAVISAALAASLGVSIPEINIRNIKRVSQLTSAWAEVGRIEQTLEKL